MDFICITGMHRSGTSLLSRTLGLLGVDMGPLDHQLPASPSNPSGFWEVQDLVDFNDELLDVLGGSWDEPPVLADGWELDRRLDDFRRRGGALLGSLFHGPSVGGWKDPRNSFSLPFWQTVTPIRYSVLMVRSPAEVAASLRERNGFSARHSARLWLRYTASAWRSHPRPIIVHYEDFFSDLDITVERTAAAVGLERPSDDTLAQIASFFDPALRDVRRPPTSNSQEEWLAAALHELLRDGRADIITPLVDAIHEQWSALAAVDENLARTRGQKDEGRSPEATKRSGGRRPGQTLRDAAERVEELEGLYALSLQEQHTAEERRKKAEADADRLARHLARLQKSASTILTSKRWRYGDTIGNVYGTLRNQGDGNGKSRKLLDLIAEGEALLKKRKGGDAVSAEHRTKGRLASSEYPYSDLQQYLCHALLNPVMHAPFTEVDRQILGVMDYELRARRDRYRMLDSGPLVSVVMPTYNRRHLLPQALASVLDQSYRNWELLLVDDGSTDDTAQLLTDHPDPRVRYLPLAENGGVARARNHGLEHARGEYVAYLDSDNTWHSDYLLVMCHALLESPDAQSIYCAQEIWNSRSGDAGETVRSLTGVRFAPFNRSLLENRNFIDLNAFLHAKVLATHHGGFDERLSRLVDWDLVLRYTAHQAPVSIPCLLSRYEFGLTQDQITETQSWTAPLGLVRGSLARRPLGIQLPSSPTRARMPRPFALTAPPAVPRYRRRVAIVIPSYEALPYLQACIDSVKAYTSARDHQLIVVDNGSSQEVVDYLKGLHDGESAQVALNEANLGFTSAVNAGITLADPDADVVLLNNDALVTPGWLEAFWEVFDLVPDAGLVVPRQTLFPGTRTMQEHVPFAKTDRELDVTLSVHHGNVRDPYLHPRRGLVELSFAPFFAVYIPRETLAAVGPLDTENGPHYRSDRLYCDVVTRYAGKKIVYTPHSKLYHFLQQSTRSLKVKDPEHHQRIYVENDWERIRSAAMARTARAIRGGA